MDLVVGKDMETESFARTFADTNLDDGNRDSMLVNCDNEEVEEQLDKIANALEQFTEDKTPYLYGEVMSMEVEGFVDDFLCSVFDYLVDCEFEVKVFFAK
ncbi:hypothetical protein Gohar_009046, partial [Gossypium harknessii]|nr:hypothetical protein [Gossypium harknessii]